jgi:hypothetical protein
MKTKRSDISLAFIMALLTIITMTSKLNAQQVRYKMTTDIPVSITTPDVVETSLGTLKFFDGFPDDATVQKVYDNLDLQRGVQAFLTGLPAALFYSVRTGIRTFGPDNQTMLITESLLDSKTLIMVANTEMVYNMAWLNTNDGPVVIDLPPHSLGFILDLWGHCVSDMGNAGPDKGQGGKYVLLPPGFQEKVPDGYIALNSRTYGNLIFIRGFVVNGDTRPAVENTKKNFRIYPLALAADPPPMNFIYASGKYYNTQPANDFSLFEHVAQVVKEEPLDAVDPETRGLLAAIGIRKDKPFEPDARMKKILTDAAAIGNATARAIVFNTRDQNSFYYPGSQWKSGFAGSDPNMSPGGVLDVDSRIIYFYNAWGITPAMTLKMIGKGSQYAYTERDAEGNYLDGSKNYQLHVPPDPPAVDFWSVIVYDPQTRSMLQTDQRLPSAGSLRKGLVLNEDNSIDVYFGPEPPEGKESNWIQTIPGKSWFTMFRLYGPLEPWFDKTWRLGEIELTK